MCSVEANTLIAQGEQAMSTKRFDDAVELFEEARVIFQTAKEREKVKIAQERAQKHLRKENTLLVRDPKFHLPLTSSIQKYTSRAPRAGATNWAVKWRM